LARVVAEFRLTVYMVTAPLWEGVWSCGCASGFSYTRVKAGLSHF